MKLLHLGDLHLGKSLGDFDLIGDQKYILNQILELADEHAVDGVMIAGDVFDRAVPSEAAVTLLDDFIKSLAERELAVYMVSGNHDSDERLNYGSRLFASRRIFIAARYEGELYRQRITDGETPVNIYMLPFVKASQVRHIFPEEAIETYEDAVRTILAHAAIDTNECNILVAHQFVTGRGSDPELGGSESVGTRTVGTVEKIGSDIFDDFDYVALGHIHSPQRVGRETVRYAGSPIKYSMSEIFNDKSVPLITIENKEIKTELLPLKPLRDMRSLKGKMKELLSEEHREGTDDFIYVTLTDDDVIPDAMGIFQQYYPNTVRIEYDNSHTADIGQVDIGRITEDKTFTEWIGDFYREIYGEEISEDELRIMREAAQEAGVINEADQS